MSESKQQRWLFFIIFIYVAIAIVGFFIAYLVKNAFFHQTNTSHAPTITMSKQAPAKKPMGWKTYTNTADKFSFSYPTDDTIQANSYQLGISSLSLTDANGNLDFQILLTPQTLALAVGQNFDSYYSMPDKSTKVIKSPLSQDNTTENFTKISNRSVHGLKAVEYQSTSSDATPGSQPEIGMFIQAGGNLILFSTGKSNNAKLEKILSSFTYPL